MTKPDEGIESVVAQLKQLRDEISLKLHLASMEAKSEWEDLERKWSDFEQRAKLEQTAEGLGSALSQLADEIKAGYDRIRKAL